MKQKWGSGGAAPRKILSIKGNGFYVNSYTMGGHGPPAPPLNPRLFVSSHTERKETRDIIILRFATLMSAYI